MVKVFRMLHASLLAALVSASLWAQSTAGNFVGTVTDSTGSLVANAKVSITKQETGLVRTATSDSARNYEFRIVEPGTYTVTVEATGFKRYSNQDLDLFARQTRRVDVTLEVGSLTESVVVTAEAPVINTESAQVGETRTAKLLSEGPRARRSCRGSG